MASSVKKTRDNYYVGYTSVYSNEVVDTESKAIKNAMKKLGGVDYIYELRFRPDCRRFIRRNAFYEKGIGVIDNTTKNGPIYETILVSGRVYKRYLLSKDGRRIKEIR